MEEEEDGLSLIQEMKEKVERIAILEEETKHQLLGFLLDFERVNKKLSKNNKEKEELVYHYQEKMRNLKSFFKEFESDEGTEEEDDEDENEDFK